MNVVFATCEHQPGVAVDDVPLVEELNALGVTVTPTPWTSIDVASADDVASGFLTAEALAKAVSRKNNPPPIVLRSTWDYHVEPAKFAAWLDALGGRTVMNPPAIARNNIDKIYLRSLADAGIPIPRTRWIDEPDARGLEQLLREERWAIAVMKPRISATGYGMHLIEPGLTLSEADLAPARSSGALVQEFIADIRTRGETSLVFVDGAFSHAVLKHPLTGDFRVQKDFGGSVVETTPPERVLALAHRVMQTVPAGCLFVRVDIVDAARGPLLMELELIEPELYFTIVPGSAARMAAVIRAIFGA